MILNEKNFANELNHFTIALNQDGLIGALRFLNKRTTHRYTGIYRYEGDSLVNIVKYDKYTDKIVQDEKVLLEVTYCSLVKEAEQYEILDASTDERVKGIINTPVISYGGVLIKDKQSNPFGTLCHFDFNRCQQRLTDLPLLKSASTMLYEYMKLQNPTKIK